MTEQTKIVIEQIVYMCEQLNLRKTKEFDKMADWIIWMKEHII